MYKAPSYGKYIVTTVMIFEEISTWTSRVKVVKRFWVLWSRSSTPSTGSSFERYTLVTPYLKVHGMTIVGLFKHDAHTIDS